MVGEVAAPLEARAGLLRERGWPDPWSPEHRDLYDELDAIGVESGSDCDDRCLVAVDVEARRLLGYSAHFERLFLFDLDDGERIACTEWTRPLAALGCDEDAPARRRWVARAEGDRYLELDPRSGRSVRLEGERRERARALLAPPVSVSVEEIEERFERPCDEVMSSRDGRWAIGLRSGWRWHISLYNLGATRR
jgi:hypothetical protein